MRTTIEVTDEQYAKLVHLAARRGSRDTEVLAMIVAHAAPPTSRPPPSA
jgi:hypothetical protein